MVWVASSATSIDGKLVSIILLSSLVLAVTSSSSLSFLTLILDFGYCSSLGSILIYVLAVGSIEVDSFLSTENFTIKQ